MSVYTKHYLKLLDSIFNTLISMEEVDTIVRVLYAEIANNNRLLNSATKKRCDLKDATTLTGIALQHIDKSKKSTRELLELFRTAKSELEKECGK